MQEFKHLHAFSVSKVCQNTSDVIEVEILFQIYSNNHCEHLGISLSFSSAYHHSGNPAEKAVRTVKGLMKCCTLAKQSWRLALIEYLATPLDSNTLSPSELNGHWFHSLLPNVSNIAKHSDQLVDRRDAQLQHHKRGDTLPELPVGSTVDYRNHTMFQLKMPDCSQFLWKMVLT